jgi:hypothetical protein
MNRRSITGIVLLALLSGCTAGGQSTIPTTAPTPVQNTEKTGSTIANAAAPIVAAAAPFPWNLVGLGALTVLSTVLGVLAKSQTSKASALQNVITAAAPQVAQIVGQITDNQTLANDITNLSQVSPAVIALIGHPSVTTGLEAAASAAQAVATSLTPSPSTPASGN